MTTWGGRGDGMGQRPESKQLTCIHQRGGMTRPQVTLIWLDLTSCWGKLEIEGHHPSSMYGRWGISATVVHIHDHACSWPPPRTPRHGPGLHVPSTSNNNNRTSQYPPVGPPLTPTAYVCMGQTSAGVPCWTCALIIITPAISTLYTSMAFLIRAAQSMPSGTCDQGPGRHVHGACDNLTFP